ncbi:unnamed protein product [Polarella glacialis]|uniref:Uncharacterized protein n=1 Tax=Polarella glacialis TaxID=89957 RepID=A0A813JCR4_POLGL|nr:unnamed protein product [Polarella glacialis]
MASSSHCAGLKCGSHFETAPRSPTLALSFLRTSLGLRTLILWLFLLASALASEKHPGPTLSASSGERPDRSFGEETDPSPKGFQAPAFLNCDGPPFSPRWSAFREVAIANAKAGSPRDEEFRHEASMLIHEYEPSMIVGARAWVVHLRSAASGDIYHLKLADGTVLSASHTSRHMRETEAGIEGSMSNRTSGVSAASVQPLAAEGAADDFAGPMSFCLYGYVQALFVEYRHSAMPDGSAPSAHFCRERRGLLLVAEQLLGSDTRETDFLDSSDWPLSALDLHVSLHLPDGLRQDRMDCHILFEHLQLPPLPLEGWPFPLQSQLPPLTAPKHQRWPRDMQLAAFGLHVSSTLEPVAALRAAASLIPGFAGTSISVTYFGHPCYGRSGDKTLRHACIYKCEMLGSPCGDDAVADVLKGMFNASSGLYEELPWSMHDALGALARVRHVEPAFANADILVCSGPLALCHLLDVLAPQTPLVYPICSQLLWGAPTGDQVASMLLGQVRLMAHQPSRRFLMACNSFAAAQCFYQTGVALPVVPRVAHYLPTDAIWSAFSEGGHWREVLVLRARYWHRLSGQYFMDVLESYLRTNEGRHNYTFVMAASMGPDELPPAEIARYRASVLIPNDFTVFAFVEVYALGVPTFVPTPEWLYRLRRAVPFGFLQPSLALPDLDGSRAGFPFPPFVSAAGRTDPGDLFAFLHWQRLSELHMRPHVPQFSSIPALLELLETVDLHDLSTRMLQHVQALRAEAANYWGSVLQRIYSHSEVEASFNEVAAKNIAATVVPEVLEFRQEIHDESADRLAELLDCRSAGHEPAWRVFQTAFQQSAALGFPEDWDLQASASSFWPGVHAASDDLTTAAALFHQVLIGEADPELMMHAGHCHFGLVAVLFVLARHGLPGGLSRARDHQRLAGEVRGDPAVNESGVHAPTETMDASLSTARQHVALAMVLLGGSSALDFLEDSSWPLSALDIASLEVALRSSPDGRGFTFGRFASSSNPLIRRAESSMPWMLGSPRAMRLAPPRTSLGTHRWRVGVAGAHPSLCADIAEAVRSALDGRAELRYFGLSCPEHQAASHHCNFRCQVLGQCSDDAIFSRILGKMLNWAEFSEQLYDEQVLMEELRGVVAADSFLRGVELLICTGPYILCGMLRQLVPAPFLVYLGLSLTYLASSANLELLLRSARRMASMPDFSREELPCLGLDKAGPETLPREFDTPSAVVVTDLIRAAQFWHATGIWVPALPPLSLYQGSAVEARTARSARSAGTWLNVIALRPELWRRAAFGPALRGLLRRFGPPAAVAVAFQRSYLPVDDIMAHDASLLVPWDNDVMSFYELYHAAMPLLIPSQTLMSKWLPAVRWGSLELDKISSYRLACFSRAEPSSAASAPWVDQSTLSLALETGAYSWIGASDYYRFPHILHFSSVAGLVAKLRGTDLVALGVAMRASSRQIRSQSLVFHRSLLSQLLDRGSKTSEARKIPNFAGERRYSSRSLNKNWRQLPGRGTCRNGFLVQEDFHESFGSGEMSSSGHTHKKGTLQDVRGQEGDAGSDDTVAQASNLDEPDMALAWKCLRLCEETAGCKVAVFNGLCCMIYDASCDASDLRQEGERAGYVAWSHGLEL